MAGVLLGTLNCIVLVSLLHLNNYSTFPSSTQSRHRSSGQHETGIQHTTRYFIYLILDTIHMNSSIYSTFLSVAKLSWPLPEPAVGFFSP